MSFSYRSSSPPTNPCGRVQNPTRSLCARSLSPAYSYAIVTLPAASSRPTTMSINSPHDLLRVCHPTLSSLSFRCSRPAAPVSERRGDNDLMVLVVFSALVQISIMYAYFGSIPGRTVGFHFIIPLGCLVYYLTFEPGLIPHDHPHPCCL